MKLLNVLKQPKFLGIGVLGALLMFLLYVHSQLLGLWHNASVWFNNIPPLNAVLLVAFVLLFGASIAYQSYLWLTPKACPADKRAKSGGASGLGTIGIFLIAQCPACASLGAVLLPLSAVTFIGEYTVWLNLLSIALLLFALNYLGAFQKE